MRNQRPDLVVLASFFLGLLLLAGLVWGNYYFTSHHPGGNDFVARWLGTRLFITEGQNPYSEASTEAIQGFFYGRLAGPGEDQQLFVYPFFSMLFFAPFALIENFALARALWMTVLEVCLIAIPLLSLSIFKWRPNRIFLVCSLLFSILWYHGFRPLINGNPSILAAFWLSLAFWQVSRQRWTAAGIYFVFSALKPQMAILVLPYVFIWALSRKNGKLIFSMLSTLALLLGLSFYLQTDWFYGMLRQVWLYPTYTQAGTLRAILGEWWGATGTKIGLACTIIFGIILVIEWIRSLGKDFQHAYWVANLSLVLGFFIGIPTTTANYIVFVPTLLLILGVVHDRWGKKSIATSLGFLLLFFVGLWALFLLTLIPGPQPLQDPILFFPVPVTLFLGLYWSKYWMLQPPVLPIRKLDAIRTIHTRQINQR